MRVLVAGSTGLVGSALVRALTCNSATKVFGVNRGILDLRNKELTIQYFKEIKPDVVLCAAAKVGGILENSRFPVEFMNDNLTIQENVFYASHTTKVKKLVFLGSSCIYPRNSPQPIKETYLMSGPLEVTNEAYALAKIAGIFQVRAYRNQYGHNWVSVMPTNLYGPNDNFGLESAHVIPAMIRKFVLAKKEQREQVEVWGDGSVLRDFLHVDDLAQAILKITEFYDSEEIINVGSGEEVSISRLVEVVSSATGFKGRVVWNNRYPSGTPRKLLDSSRVRDLGWSPKISLENGILTTIQWFESHYKLSTSRSKE